MRAIYPSLTRRSSHRSSKLSLKPGQIKVRPNMQWAKASLQTQPLKSQRKIICCGLSHQIHENKCLVEVWSSLVLHHFFKTEAIGKNKSVQRAWMRSNKSTNPRKRMVVPSSERGRLSAGVFWSMWPTTAPWGPAFSILHHHRSVAHMRRRLDFGSFGFDGDPPWNSCATAGRRPALRSAWHLGISGEFEVRFKRDLGHPLELFLDFPGSYSESCMS